MNETAGMEAIAEGMYASQRNVRLGAYLIGLIITVSLQTAATLQFTSWCNSSWKSERTWLRFLTVWMIVSGTGFAVTQCVRAFDVFVSHYGQYESLLRLKVARFLTVFMSMAHLGSEAFYIHRAYVLSGRRRALLVGFGVFWFALLAVSIAAILKLPESLVNYGPVQFALFTAQGALLTMVDVSITAFTIILLYRRRDIGAHTSANNLINRLILVETQLPVSIVVVVSTGFIASGSFFYSPIFTALICGLSQVTLFKVLNSRQIIRERAGLVTTEVQDAPTTEWKMDDSGPPRLDYSAGPSSETGGHNDARPAMRDTLYYGSRPETV